MRKTAIIIFMGICCLIITFTLYFLWKSSIDFKTLSGDIAIINIIEKDTHGITIFTPNTGNYNGVLKGILCDKPSYSEDKQRMLVVPTASNPEVDSKATILEYRFKDMCITPLVKYNETGDNAYSNIKYVPTQNAISYNMRLKLYYFDLTSRTQTYLTDAVGGYTWAKDGKSFLFCYNRNDKIYQYNMESKEIKPLFDGYSPEYSKSNDYIAYITRSGLAVKEVKTGKEWIYKTRAGIHCYRFSPDDRYVAIEQTHHSIISFLKYYDGYEMKVWEFKTGKVKTLIEHISSTYRDFDWR